MSLIPRDILDEIATRLDLASIIGEHVPLKKAGKDYKGLCPFHQEKSPSFMVNPDKGIFHCFGCGQGGNVFGFLMKIENLTFPEAVRRLADRAGVDLSPYEKGSGEKRDTQEILYKINRYVAWFYSEYLQSKAGEKVRQYLEKRGISPETQKKFALGYAPDGWEELARFLKAKNVPLAEAEQLGLIRKRKDGSSYYDFFRHRLMFPIMDYEGRVIGFGGRRLSDAKDVQEAKYINSPESPIYVKGRSIYGLFQAKQSIRQKEEVILVEGYMDLIRLFQEGIENVAAPLGTALTETQVMVLKRFAEKYILLFDGDEAGRNAQLRALHLLLGLGIHPKVVPLPQGEDPDTYVAQKGPEMFQNMLEKAPHALEWMLTETLSKTRVHTADRLESVKKLLPLVQQLPSEMERKTYTSRLAQFLGIPENALNESVRRSSVPETRKSTPGKPEPKKGNFLKPSQFSLERILIQLYLKYPNVVSDLITDTILEEFKDERLKELGRVLIEQYAREGELEPSRLLVPGNSLDENFVSELVVGFQTPEAPDEIRKMALDCASRWKEERFKSELQELTDQIQVAETRNDQEALRELLARKNATLKKPQKSPDTQGS